MKNIIISLIVIISIIVLMLIFYPKKEIEIDYELVMDTDVLINNFDVKYQEYLKMNFFNGEYVNDIGNKLDKLFNSSLEGEGYFVASYSIEKGVDPYLTAAVILEETGCMWTCSYLARTCNNYGGIKGSPGCNGGSYRSFGSKEEGLKYTIDKLASYYNNGLTTPEAINPKYATSTSWASKINNYMDKLRNA